MRRLIIILFVGHLSQTVEALHDMYNRILITF